MATKAQGDFAEHRALILAELQRLNTLLEALRTKIDDMNLKDISEIKTEIAMIKVKVIMGASIAATLLSAGLTLFLNTVLHK